MVKFFRDGKLVSEVDCFQGLNLLAHAQIEEQETGSECGGHGKCGKDRVLVAPSDRQKLNAPTSIERRLFGEDELIDGWRLACQAFPNVNDLEITVELR